MGNAQRLLSIQSNMLDMLRRLCILVSDVNECYKCEVHEEPRCHQIKNALMSLDCKFPTLRLGALMGDSRVMRER